MCSLAIHAYANKQSFQVFAAERKRDRAKGFDVEQIIAQLLELVQTCGMRTK